MVSSPGLRDYQRINRANWDERAPAHAASPDYAVDRFVADADFLSAVVRFDRPLLGDISGQRGVHLQCHIGTDTLSLARLGARMSGLDLSPVSLQQARALAAATGTDIDYHEADVYDAPTVLGRAAYDLVYTGIGALCWLPRIVDWARTVEALLKPGGRLFVREGHPMLWAMSDPRPDGLLVADFPYFETPQPTVWDDAGTYVATDVELTATTTHSWSHGLGEVIGALLAAGLQITGCVEHRSVPWDALPGMMTQLDDGEWQLSDRPERLPHTYTLQAVKPGSTTATVGADV